MGLGGMFLSSVKKSVTQSMRQHTWNFIDIETPITNTVLMTKKGSMLTVLEYKGLNNFPGAEEFDEAQNELHMLLENLFSSKGVTLQFVNDVNDDKTRPYVEAAVAAQRATAARFNFDISDVIDSNVAEICKYATYDKTYIALWTGIGAFDPKEGKEIIQEASADLKEYSQNLAINPAFVDTISTNMFKTELYDKHRSTVTVLLNALERVGARFNVLHSRQVGTVLKGQIEPEVTPENFSPVIPGDEYSPRTQAGNTEGEAIDDVLYPRFDRQLARLAHYPSVDNPGVYQVGSTYYYSMYVDVFPRRLRPFAVLKKAIPKGIQYRTSMLVNSGFTMAYSINSVMAAFFPFSSKNKAIRKSFDIMGEMAEDEERIMLQMHVVTMSDSLEGLKKNRQALLSAFMEWGGTSLALDVADPKETYISSATGASPTSPVEASHPTVDDMAFCAPLFRPTSQWEKGSVLFTSPDGVLMPFQPASDKQESASTAIIARPRMGKSVLANAILLAQSTQGGLTRLPRIVALDIGNSSAGFIAVLKDSLPTNERHKVNTIELQNTERNAKNILDIQLGANGPLPTERGIIQNFIEMIITDHGKEPEPGLSQLITTAIDEAYEAFEREEHIPRYSSGMYPQLDAIVEEHNVHTTETDTPIRNIRDELFERELYREAEIAQLYCVPTLTDLPNIVVNSAKLQRGFGKDSAYPELIEKFRVNLTAALRRYPILAGHTQLDLSGSRVVALDLTAVAPKNDPKQTGIMYALATHAAANDFFINKNDIMEFEPKYRKYQEKRIESMAEDQKIVQFDELHRPAESPHVVNMIRQYQLEGPKYKVGVTLISQFVKHFKDLLQACTNVFILGQPDQTEINHIDEALKLRDSEFDIIRNRSHGPKPGGSSLLHRMTTNDGTYYQQLKFPFGAIGLWGLGTSGDDRAIMAKLTNRLPGPLARAIMARYFPKGTIKTEVENRRDSHIDASKSIVDTIFDDVMKWAREDGLLDNV